MKNRRNLKQLALAIMLIALVGFLGSCATGGLASSSGTDAGTKSVSGKKGRKAKKEVVYNPSGVWEYDVITPDGSNSGVMKITGEPGNFEVLLETDQFGEMRVFDLEMTGDTMRGKIDAGGATVEIEGDFDGDSFSGAVIIGEEAYPIEGVRTSKN